MFTRPLLALGLLGIFAVPVGAQDSSPQLISRTGGTGSWHNTAELEKAAAAGNQRAWSELGERLLSGDEVKQDVPRGFELLERAARAGNASAAFRLGYQLEHGAGIAEDHARALAYFRAAAAGGVSEAYYNVGAAYGSGRGVRRDFVEALAWMILAREHHAPGDGEARVRAYLTEEKRSDWIKQGEARAPLLAAELAAHPVEFFLPPSAPLSATGTSRSAQAVARQPAPVSPAFASSGQLPLPPLPEPHLGLPASAQTPDEASGSPVGVVSINARRLEWPSLEALERDAHHHQPDALFALGQLSLDGEKVPLDVDRGLMLLERGAAEGSVDAAYRLADTYIHGRITALDEKRGFTYMLMAARHGARTAMYNVASLYTNGRGTEHNYTEALAWFLVAEHYGADFGSGAKIRDYLSRNAPEQIPAAQHRAEQLQGEIEAFLKEQR